MEWEYYHSYQQDIANCLSSELQCECSNHCNGDNGGQWREGAEKAEVKRKEFWTFHLYLFIAVSPLERLHWCDLKKKIVLGDVSIY